MMNGLLTTLKASQALKTQILKSYSRVGRSRYDFAFRSPCRSNACRLYWSKYTGRSSDFHPSNYYRWRKATRKNAKRTLERVVEDREMTLLVREEMQAELLQMRVQCGLDNYRTAFEIYDNLTGTGVLELGDTVLFLSMLRHLFTSQRKILFIASSESYAEQQKLDKKLTEILFKVIDSLKTNKNYVNSKIWSLVLRILLESQNLEKFEKVWEHVRELPVQIGHKSSHSRVDASCYACAIEYKAQVGEPLESCRELLREAVKKKLEPTPELYRSMVLCLLWHDQDKEAFELLELACEMIPDKLSTSWLSGLLSRLSRWGKPEYAVICFNKFATVSILPEPMTMTVLLTEMKITGSSLESIFNIFFQYISLGGNATSGLTNCVLDSIFQNAMMIVLEKKLTEALEKDTCWNAAGLETRPGNLRSKILEVFRNEAHNEPNHSVGDSATTGANVQECAGIENGHAISELNIREESNIKPEPADDESVQSTEERSDMELEAALNDKHDQSINKTEAGNDSDISAEEKDTIDIKKLIKRNYTSDFTANRGFGPVSLQDKNFLKSILFNKRDQTVCDNTALMANRFLDKMTEKGYKISVETYNTLISGYFSLGDRERVTETLGKLDKSGLTPSPSTFRVILKTFQYSNAPISIIEEIWTRLQKINHCIPYDPSKHDLDWLMLLKILNTTPLKRQEMRRFLLKQLITYAPRYCSSVSKVFVQDSFHDTLQRSDERDYDPSIKLKNIPLDLVALFRRQKHMQFIYIAQKILDIPKKDRGGKSIEFLLLRIGETKFLESDIARIERIREEEVEKALAQAAHNVVKPKNLRFLHKPEKQKVDEMIARHALPEEEL